MQNKESRCSALVQIKVNTLRGIMRPLKCCSLSLYETLSWLTRSLRVTPRYNPNHCMNLKMCKRFKIVPSPQSVTRWGQTGWMRGWSFIGKRQWVPSRRAVRGLRIVPRKMKRKHSSMDRSDGIWKHSTKVIGSTNTVWSWVCWEAGI